MKKVLVSCLEPSANLHLQWVLKELGDVEIYGIYDEKFGGKPLYKSSEFSAMGFVEILPLIFKAKKAAKQMVELAKECDVILLIDSPAFNLALAKKIKDAGIKTPITYYILPQVWAWKEKRVTKVERYCDNLASIWPFEQKFYKKANYVGHPLLDEITKRHKYGEKHGIIAFMPGSRKSEILRLMPVYKNLALKFPNERKILIVPEKFKGNLPEFYGDTNGFELAFNTQETLIKADFAFICSGTATLEAALIGTPFVLCYKAKAIDIFIARRFVKLKHAGLANIIMDFTGKDELHTELLQDEVSVENLYNAYLNCDEAKFHVACDEIKEYLKFGAAKNVARILKDKQL